MIPQWEHFRYTMIHKYWVFRYCIREGLIWQGIMHDISKFTISEFFPYANYFFGKGFPNECWHGDVRNCIKFEWTVAGYKEAFDYAWLTHQNRNKHHWHYWVTVSHKGEVYAEDMPYNYIKEMICDWRAAGKAKQTSDGGIEGAKKYYLENRDRMILSSPTKVYVEELLGV